MWSKKTCIGYLTPTRINQISCMTIFIMHGVFSVLCFIQVPLEPTADSIANDQSWKFVLAASLFSTLLAFFHFRRFEKRKYATNWTRETPILGILLLIFVVYGVGEGIIIMATTGLASNLHAHFWWIDFLYIFGVCIFAFELLSGTFWAWFPNQASTEYSGSTTVMVGDAGESQETQAPRMTNGNKSSKANPVSKAWTYFKGDLLLNKAKMMLFTWMLLSGAFFIIAFSYLAIDNTCIPIAPPSGYVILDQTWRYVYYFAALAVIVCYEMIDRLQKHNENKHWADEPELATIFAGFWIYAICNIIIIYNASALETALRHHCTGVYSLFWSGFALANLFMIAGILSYNGKSLMNVWSFGRKGKGKQSDQASSETEVDENGGNREEEEESVQETVVPGERE